jgi:hypothetical protein
MRFFFTGPRIFGIRPGVSFGAGDFGAKTQAAPAGKPVEGGFVYVIRGDHNLIKIGVSTNPTARLASLRTASPFPIEFAYVCAVRGPSTEAFALEADAHALLNRQRLNGEWFDIPADMAVAAIAAAGHKSGRKFVEIDPSQVDTVIRLAAQAPQQAAEGRIGFGGRLGITFLGIAVTGFATAFAGWSIGASIGTVFGIGLVGMLWSALG